MGEREEGRGETSGQRAAKLREQQPDLAAGNKEVREAPGCASYVRLTDRLPACLPVCLWRC